VVAPGFNRAADDAAGLAISTRMQTQINGLNRSVSTWRCVGV